MWIVLGGVTHWLWRAISEHGGVLDVMLEKTRCKYAVERCLQRLLDDKIDPSV